MKKLEKQKKYNDLGYFTNKEALLNSLWSIENKKVVDGKWFIPLSKVIKLLEDK